MHTHSVAHQQAWYREPLEVSLCSVFISVPRLQHAAWQDLKGTAPAGKLSPTNVVQGPIPLSFVRFCEVSLFNSFLHIFSPSLPYLPPIFPSEQLFLHFHFELLHFFSLVTPSSTTEQNVFLLERCAEICATDISPAWASIILAKVVSGSPAWVEWLQGVIWPERREGTGKTILEGKKTSGSSSH